MKQILKSAASAMSLLTLVLSVAAAPAAVAAGSASMYLSPASGTYDVGDTFNVAVHEDSGSTPVYAVQANLTYSTSKLAYVSYTTSSAFSIEAENPDGNDGSINFARGSITSRTGDQTVVTVKFKALAATSAASVSIAAGSSIADGDGTNILNDTNNGSYKIVSPTTSPPPASPPPAPSPPPSAPPASNGGTTTSPPPASAPKDKSAPKITNIEVINITSDSAVISWQTSEPATSVVKYGIDTKKQLNIIDTKRVTSHSLTIASGILAPGTTYHYSVSSTDAAGNVAVSKDATFDTLAATYEPTKTPYFTNTKVLSVAGVIVAATILIIAGLLIARHLHRSRLEKAELARHFPDNYNGKPPQGPAAPTTPTVFTPTNPTGSK